MDFAGSAGSGCGKKLQLEVAPCSLNGGLQARGENTVKTVSGELVLPPEQAHLTTAESL